MSESGLILNIRDNGIATIALNRPELHNAFDDHLITEITETIRKLDNNNDVRVIAFAAKGKSFSAGADLNWMKKMAGYSWEQNYQDSLQLAGLMNALYESKKTTVALVQGAAFGGGVGLVACCDIALVSKKSLILFVRSKAWFNSCGYFSLCSKSHGRAKRQTLFCYRRAL